MYTCIYGGCVRSRSHTALAYVYVGFFACFFAGTQSFQENRLFIFHAFVALRLLVSLIGRLVACTARISVDRQTNRQTNRHTKCIQLHSIHLYTCVQTSAGHQLCRCRTPTLSVTSCETSIEHLHILCTCTYIHT